MKIAVISDIHGNLEALDAVLNDIKINQCDKIICLGDIALAGPEPSKTIDKIKSLIKECDFSVIQGNTDERLSKFSQEFLDAVTVANVTMANAYLADLEELSDEDKIFLGELEKHKELNIADIKILLVHGSPRRNDENIFPDLAVELVEEMIKGVDANLIFCGHTHIPCGYQTNTNQTVVNVGSVGRPFSNDPKSCYVVLDIDEDTSTYSLEHKFVPYDFETAAKKMLNRKFEGAEKLAKMLECATSRYPD